MSMYRKIGFACALALTGAACGSNTSTDDASIGIGLDGPAPVTRYDAGTAIDTATPVADPYVWVVVQDTEQKACTSNGPGTDVDAVAKLNAAGTPIAYGLKGSAKFTPNTAFACDNPDCPAGNCKYAYNSLTVAPADLVARTEGPADGQVKAVGDDIGYFSLNAGTLQLQIGDLTGAGPAQAIKSGDWISVFEVDKTYAASGAAPATCTCAPEHYKVSLQTATGKTLALKPASIDTTLNTTCSALTATTVEGCGTSVFAVP